MTVWGDGDTAAGNDTEVDGEWQVGVGDDDPRVSGRTTGLNGGLNRLVEALDGWSDNACAVDPGPSGDLVIIGHHKHR